MLEFDHLADKKAEVIDLMKRSWKVVEAEIAKCITINALDPTIPAKLLGCFPSMTVGASNFTLGS